MERSNQAASDIEGRLILEDNLIKSLKYEMGCLPPPSLSCCICRVPKPIREQCEKAYTPQVVSIGPLHSGRLHLRAMEEVKVRYLRDFLCRTQISIEDYANKIRSQELGVRSFYEEPIRHTSDQFVRMILLDAVFIIEFFLKLYFLNKGRNEYDPISNSPWVIHSIAPDIWKLENQLPFFILNDLFDLGNVRLDSNHDSTAGSQRPLSLIECSYNFFKMTMRLRVEEDDSGRVFSSFSYEVEHFVDLCRYFLLPKAMESKSGRGQLKTLTTPSMTELYWAGVKFEVTSDRAFLDIRFNNGTLEIPKSSINEETMLLIRNFLAFEQFHSKKSYISDYVFFMMYGLARTPQDVKFLVDYGIVEDWLRAKSADSYTGYTLINQLQDLTVMMNPTNSYFATLGVRSSALRARGTSHLQRRRAAAYTPGVFFGLVCYWDRVLGP